MAEDSVDFSLLVGPSVPSRSYSSGQVIFNEGDAATELFVIESGRVKIMLGNRLLDEFSENSIFGEMALIDAKPRSATAIAGTDVTLVPITEKQFLFLVSNTPYFALKVMRVMAGRLRVTNKAL